MTPSPIGRVCLESVCSCRLIAIGEVVGATRDEEIHCHVALEPFGAVIASEDRIVLELFWSASQEQLYHGPRKSRYGYRMTGHRPFRHP